MRRLIRLAFVSAVVGVLVAGCAADSRHSYGASLDADGEGIRLHYVLCGGDLLRVVTLTGYEGGGSQAAEPIYWRIEAPAGSRQTEYVVGDVPPGFVAVVPLNAEIPGEEMVSLDGYLESDGMSIRVPQLGAGRVTRGDYSDMTVEGFMSDGSRYCGERTINNVVGVAGLLPIGFLLTVGAARLRRPTVPFALGATALYLIAAALVWTGAGFVAIVIGGGENALALVEGAAVVTIFFGVFVLGIAIGSMLLALLVLRWLPARARRAGAVTIGVLSGLLCASLLPGSEPDPLWLVLAAPGIVWGLIISLPHTQPSTTATAPARSERALWPVVAVLATAGAIVGLALEYVQGPVAVALDRVTDQWPLSDYRETDALQESPPEIEGVLLSFDSDGVVAEEHGYVSARFSPTGDYWVHFTCTGTSLQFAEGSSGEGWSSNPRHLVPCATREAVQRKAPLPEPGHTGEIRVFPNGTQRWAIVVTTSPSDPFEP